MAEWWAAPVFRITSVPLKGNSDSIPHEHSFPKLGVIYWIFVECPSLSHLELLIPMPHYLSWKSVLVTLP